VRLDETPTTKVSLHVEAEMVAPIWLQGAFLEEARQAIAESVVGDWFGARITSGMTPEAFRYDQCMKGEGEIVFEGKTYPFSGYGLHGHVRGTRVMGGMMGHTWMGGAGPGGAAFGVSCFPRPEGGFFYSEAFLFKDGVLYPARAQYAPPVSHDPGEGEYYLELVCDQLGLTRIACQNHRDFWWSMPAWGSGQAPRWGIAPEGGMVMRQGLASYKIGAAAAYGFSERSGERGDARADWRHPTPPARPLSRSRDLPANPCSDDRAPACRDRPAALRHYISACAFGARSARAQPPHLGSRRPVAPASPRNP
jgi:hypothetical protein